MLIKEYLETMLKISLIFEIRKIYNTPMIVRCWFSFN